MKTGESIGQSPEGKGSRNQGDIYGAGEHDGQTPGISELMGGMVLFAGCGQKKRAGLLQAPLNVWKEKKPCGLKSKNLEANNRLLNLKGLEFDTFGLCALLYAVLVKCLRV